MSTRFSTLLQLDIQHEFYGGGCPDFGLILPADCQRLLQRGRLLLKERDNRWHLLFEQDSDGEPLAMLAGQTLRLGLQLLNPYFDNFTSESLALAGEVPVYRNRVTPDALAAPVRMPLCSGFYRHVIAQPQRPVTLQLRRSDAELLHSITITAADDRPSFAFDLRELPAGEYWIEEHYPGDVVTQTAIYADAELGQQAVAAVLELRLDATFYETAPVLSLQFSAKQQALRFYLVVRNYSDAEFAQLSVSDHGFVEDGRSEIPFQRIASASFGAEEIPVELLARQGERVVLFRSQVAVGRQARPRRKLQLRRNGDILIEHLPQPGPDSAKAEQIVLVGKPG